MSKKWVVGLVLLGAFLGVSTANAQSKKAKAKDTKEDSGYGYTFDDDPLAAGGFGPGDATIKIRKGPVRSTLIRPRTEFMVEMMKSVENL